MHLVLRVCTLGSFCVYRGEEPVPDAAWKTQKHKTLLKILLTHRGRAVSRDQLMEWLWPEPDPEAAGRNLRVAVSRVRRALEPELSRGSESRYVLTTPSGYAWEPKAAVELDVEEFETLCAQFEFTPDSDSQALQEQVENAERAKALYRGEYLEEDRYEDWAIAKREELRELYFSLLTKLAEAHARLGHYDRSVELCREVLTHDRCREGIWRGLMLYRCYSGEQALALSAYEECRKALAEELGIEPLPETTALYEQILRREVPEPRPEIPNNLPRELTRFIGREAELAQIAKHLQSSSCRLLTLVGPGGVGKTRLALRAASEATARFPDGVYFVSLAPLSSPDFLVAAVAESLGLCFYGPEDPEAQLLSRLREKKMLLVLDNFEHLLAGAGLTIELLRRAPEVKVLVTSREPLNLQAEWRLEIAGLPYPSDREESSAAELEAYGAVKLFLERARRVRADFSFPQAPVHEVLRICRFLEGMPLGIELAAAQAGEFSCREIARQIEQNLEFLAVSMRDLPERHRSLRAVFDASWDLLSEEEQIAFRNLSVFRGGFDPQAAEAVANASPRVLASLVEKSLLRRESPGRFTMHELLRQYAGEKLHTSPVKEKEAQAAHCRYYAAFLHEREEALRRGSCPDALDEVGREIENLRIGWEWAVTRCRPEEVGTFLNGLYRYYGLRGWYRAGEEALKRAARRIGSCAGPTAEALLGRLLLRRGGFCYRLNEYAKARDLFRRSLAIFRRLRLPEETASALHMLGSVAYMRGDYGEAGRRCRQCLALCEETGDRGQTAKCLNMLALAVGGAEGRRLLEESLAISREIGNRRTAARALSYLGLLAGGQGRYAEARKRCREALEAYQAMENQWGIAHTLDYLGNIALMTGESSEAARLYEESAVIWKEIGHRWGLAVFALHRGELASLAGKHPEAKEHYEEGLALFAEIGDRPGIASSLGGWAGSFKPSGAMKRRRDSCTRASRSTGRSANPRGLPLPCATWEISPASREISGARGSVIA